MDEHNVAASAVTHAALAPAVEDNAPAAAVTYAEQAPDVERIAVTNARSIENLDELPAVPELVETTEAYFTEETNGNVPMQKQIKNGEGDWKKEAQPAPKEPEEKYEWASGVKKRKRPKGKRTDVARATSGTTASAANIFPKRMDEETEMRASRQEI